MDQPFATQLKIWRAKRRLSQLDLATTSDVSARHIAFLETGRAQPSRAMVLRLARHLEVPLADRNDWLRSAGFSVQFRKRSPDDIDLAPVRAALDHLLQRHEPFPGFIIDRHWSLMKLNRPAAMLFGALGLAEGDSLLDRFVDATFVETVFENAAEIRAHLSARLRTESAHFGGDPTLDRAVAALAGLTNDAEVVAGSAVIPARVRTPAGTLSLLTLLAQFGATTDLALAELKIELMYPADDATRSWLLAQAHSTAQE